MNVVEVGVILEVADMTRTTAFYQTLLATEPSSIDPWWTEFDCAGLKLSLARTGDEPTPESEVAKAGVILRLSVENIHAEFERLRGAGLTLSEPQVEEHMNVATAALTDPDGHTLQLIESAA